MIINRGMDFVEMELEVLSRQNIHFYRCVDSPSVRPLVRGMVGQLVTPPAVGLPTKAVGRLAGRSVGSWNRFARPWIQTGQKGAFRKNCHVRLKTPFDA